MSRTIVCCLLLTVLSRIYDPATAAKLRRDKAFEECQPVTAETDPSINKNSRRAPVVEGDQKYKTAHSGESVHMHCDIRGVPRPRVVWYKNGQELQPDGDNVSVHKSTLFIRNLTFLHHGKYKCVASNQCGTAEWEFSLEVIVDYQPMAPPLILANAVNKTVEENSNVTFTCETFSGSAITTWWKQRYQVNGSWTDPEGQQYARPVKKDYKKPHMLTLMSVSAEDAGIYDCILENEHGRSVRSQWLTVLLQTEPSHIAEKSIVPWVMLGVVMAAVLIATPFVVRLLCRRQTHHHAKDNVFNPLYPLIPPMEMKNIPYDGRWEMPRDNLTIGEVIGEGFFGKVYKGYALGLFNRLEPVIVAVKTLKDNATTRELDTLVQEMNTMKSIGDHLNIINFLGCCTQDGPLYILVEYAPHGSLRDFLQKQKPGAPLSGKDWKYEQPQSVTTSLDCLKPLTGKDLVSFAYQVARGMNYLSFKNIIHRDLAARNILVAEGNILKIADFGLTRELKEREYYTKQTEIPLPIKWMALECLRERKFLPKSDVWSFGVLLWEIFTYGSNPYPALDLSLPDSLCCWLAQGNRMDRPSHSPQEMYTLMLKCWREEAAERPSFSQLVDNLDSILVTMSEDYLDLSQDVDYCDQYLMSEPDATRVLDGRVDDCVFHDDSIPKRRGTKHSQRSDYSSLSTNSLDKSRQSLESLDSRDQTSVHSSGLESIVPSVSSDPCYSPVPYRGRSASDSHLHSQLVGAAGPGDGLGSAGEGSGDEEYQAGGSLLGHKSAVGRQREQYNTQLLKLPSVDKDVCILGESHVPYANFYRTTTNDKYHFVEFKPPPPVTSLAT